MKKKTVLCLIIALVVSELVLFYKNHSLRQEIDVKDNSINELSIENIAIRPQFAISLFNIGKRINGEIEITDTLGISTRLDTYMENQRGNILICRTSEQYCQLCCELAIRKLLQSSSNFDIQRILFLDHSTSRIFKLYVKEHQLYNYNVANCPLLGIPAEDLMFPYYMVLDKSLTIKGIYVPSKSAFDLPVDSVNLNLMYKALIEP